MNAVGMWHDGFAMMIIGVVRGLSVESTLTSSCKGEGVGGDNGASLLRGPVAVFFDESFLIAIACDDAVSPHMETLE